MEKKTPNGRLHVAHERHHRTIESTHTHTMLTRSMMPRFEKVATGEVTTEAASANAASTEAKAAGCKGMKSTRTQTVDASKIVGVSASSLQSAVATSPGSEPPTASTGLTLQMPLASHPEKAPLASASSPRAAEITTGAEPLTLSTELLPQMSVLSCPEQLSLATGLTSTEEPAVASAGCTLDIAAGQGSEATVRQVVSAESPEVETHSTLLRTHRLSRKEVDLLQQGQMHNLVSLPSSPSSSTRSVASEVSVTLDSQGQQSSSPSVSPSASSPPSSCSTPRSINGLSMSATPESTNTPEESERQRFQQVLTAAAAANQVIGNAEVLQCQVEATVQTCQTMLGEEKSMIDLSSTEPSLPDLSTSVIAAAGYNYRRGQALNDDAMKRAQELVEVAGEFNLAKAEWDVAVRRAKLWKMRIASKSEAYCRETESELAKEVTAKETACTKISDAYGHVKIGTGDKSEHFDIINCSLSSDEVVAIPTAGGGCCLIAAIVTGLHRVIYHTPIDPALVLQQMWSALFKMLAMTTEWHRRLVELGESQESLMEYLRLRSNDNSREKEDRDADSDLMLYAQLAVKAMGSVDAAIVAVINNAAGPVSLLTRLTQQIARFKRVMELLQTGKGLPGTDFETTLDGPFIAAFFNVTVECYSKNEGGKGDRQGGYNCIAKVKGGSQVVHILKTPGHFSAFTRAARKPDREVLPCGIRFPLIETPHSVLVNASKGQFNHFDHVTPTEKGDASAQSLTAGLSQGRDSTVQNILSQNTPVVNAAAMAQGEFQNLVLERIAKMEQRFEALQNGTIKQPGLNIQRKMSKAKAGDKTEPRSVTATTVASGPLASAASQQQKAKTWNNVVSSTAAAHAGSEPSAQQQVWQVARGDALAKKKRQDGLPTRAVITMHQKENRVPLPKEQNEVMSKITTLLPKSGVRFVTYLNSTSALVEFMNSDDVATAMAYLNTTGAEIQMRHDSGFKPNKRS